MNIIFTALIVELILPLMAVEWSHYGAISEFRILFWMVICFVISNRQSIYYRAIILFCCVCQVWSFFIHALYAAGVELNCHISDALGYAAIVSFVYVLLKEYERPEIAISAKDIEKESCYLIVRNPSIGYFKDVVLSLFGIPATSVCVYLAGSVYAFSKESGCYEVKKNVKVKTNSKYAIKIHVKNMDEAHLMLSENLGKKYRFIKLNCVNVLKDFSKYIGVELNPLQRMIPGLFVSKLVKVLT